MKRFKIHFILITSFLFVGCNSIKKKPASNWKNAVVHEKILSMDESHYYFRIEFDKKLTVIQLTRFDYNRFNVGDTIK